MEPQRWLSAELNALLDAQGLPRLDSGGFLNSPHWRTLLNWEEGSSPLHPDSTASDTATLPAQLQHGTKRGRDEATSGGTSSEPSSPTKRKIARRMAISTSGGGSGAFARAESLLPLHDNLLMELDEGAAGLGPLAPVGPTAPAAVLPQPPPLQPTFSITPALAALGLGIIPAAPVAPSPAPQPVLQPADAVATLVVPFPGSGATGGIAKAAAGMPMIMPAQQASAAAAAAAAAAVASTSAAITRAAAAQPAAPAPAPAAPAASAAPALAPAPGSAALPHRLPKKSHKAVPTGNDGVFTSMFRGVTRHKMTGRWEAHYWDSTYIRATVGKKGRSRGRQLYLGGYDTEAEAARAYDYAALAHAGPKAATNFPVDAYTEFLASIEGKTAEEVVAQLRESTVSYTRNRQHFRATAKQQQSLQQQQQGGAVRRVLQQSSGSVALWGQALPPQVPVPLLQAPAYLATFPPGAFMPPPWGAAKQAQRAAQQPGPLPAGEGMDVDAEAGAGTPTTGVSSAAEVPPVLPQLALLGLESRELGPEVVAALQPIPKLPAIRVHKPGTAAAAPSSTGGAGTAAAGLAGAPAAGLSGQLSMDLASFGLSPLAASILSPLGLGDPALWRDSPLGRELAKMSTEDINRLMTGDCSVFNSPTKAPGSRGSGAADQGGALWEAMQWLDGMDTVPAPGSGEPTPTPAPAQERAQRAAPKPAVTVKVEGGGQQ